MICSSVRIIHFVVHPFLGADSRRSWRKYPGAGQLLYYCLKSDVGPVAHAKKRNFESIFGLRHHLSGLIAFASQIEPEYRASLAEEMKKIVWPL